MSDDPSWYADGLRFACTGCGDCCRLRGDYAFVYLMESEAAAMAAHLGLELETFLERYCEKDQGWLVLRSDRPECAFLDEHSRCRVYPVRPVQCRTWPFWEHTLVQRVWEGEVLATCPGAGEGVLHSAVEARAIARATEDWYEGRVETWDGPEPRSE